MRIFVGSIVNQRFHGQFAGYGKGVVQDHYNVYRPVMNGGQLPTNRLVHVINWDTFDHASVCASQLMPCNYCVWGGGRGECV